MDALDGVRAVRPSTALAGGARGICRQGVPFCLQCGVAFGGIQLLLFDAKSSCQSDACQLTVDRKLVRTRVFYSYINLGHSV